MKRRSLLLLLAGSGCWRVPRRELAFGRALIGLARDIAFVDESQVTWSLTELSRLVDEAESALASSPRRSPATVLSELLFGRWGFVREVADTNLAFVCLPGVLERRRGSCVGLGTLFLALADALGHSASGVMMPGHFYVRVQEQGGARNVELLRAGEAMPDAWYGQRFPVPGGSAREYARPLSQSEVLGVVEYNVGNERRRQLRLAEARAAYIRATGLFPELSEAHASLGAVEQLLGNLESAEASYRRACNANPHLPGIEQNLSLLAAERTTATTPRACPLPPSY
ncbi:transglutaminase family protein [Sorangium sp. So ce448]|uniref:transglutaminase family protein n=1 Tax=Sorangium sp. So ce448 TaxID=3133314 RepID=UPI003F5FA547